MENAVENQHFSESQQRDEQNPKAKSQSAPMSKKMSGYNSQNIFNFHFAIFPIIVYV